LSIPSDQQPATCNLHQRLASHLRHEKHLFVLTCRGRAPVVLDLLTKVARPLYLQPVAFDGTERARDRNAGATAPALAWR